MLGFNRDMQCVFYALLYFFQQLGLCCFTENTVISCCDFGSLTATCAKHLPIISDYKCLVNACQVVLNYLSKDIFNTLSFVYTVIL